MEKRQKKDRTERGNEYTADQNLNFDLTPQNHSRGDSSSADPATLWINNHMELPPFTDDNTVTETG